MNLERHKHLHEKRKLNHLNLTFIISLHLIYKRHFLIFERDDNTVGAVSGKIEPNEFYAETAIRELEEETSLKLDPSQIHDSGHFFLANSPKGKIVFGTTLYANLCSKTFEPSQIKLNSELFDYEILPFKQAIRKITHYGHPESVDGIHYILNRMAIKVKDNHSLMLNNTSDGSFVDLSRLLPWRN